eukprot:GSChrysophyteH1.ASY1.ANO1.152.1 assembled CDS
MSCSARQKIRKDELESILSRHPDVAGFNVAYMFDYEVKVLSAGFARLSTREVMTPAHYMEAASLSKTVGTAFAVEYFTARGISMQTPVNSLLRKAGSEWTISLPPEPASDLSSEWPDQVTLAQLVNHTALGMHYVFGLPLSHGMPPIKDFLNGSLEHSFGYAPLYLEKKPGSSFKYSGGGFITMQDEEVAPHDGGRLAFPALAAGGLCTPQSLLRMLAHLAQAFRAYEEGDRNYKGPISPETAYFMLGEDNLQDLGSIAFMRSRVGHGVFVATAGRNRLMMHQAANEGFRGVYFVCFSGPDRGKGFVVLCNGDNPAVMAQSEASRYLLAGSSGSLNFQGVDFSTVNTFNMTGLKQEEIVNLGLKELVLAGFQDDASGSLISKL